MSAVDTIAGAAETRGTDESRQRHCFSGDTTSWYERRWPWWHGTASSRPEQQLHAVGKTWPRLIRTAATYILWHFCTVRLSRYNKQQRRWPCCCWDAALVQTMVFWDVAGDTLRATLDARRQRPAARSSWASLRRPQTSGFYYAARADRFAMNRNMPSTIPRAWRGDCLVHSNGCA